MITALMLFGSAARGDVDKDSDIDLLAVSDTGRPFSQKNNGIEIQFIDADSLISLGKTGDLFALHLAREGEVIFDFCGQLSLLKSVAKPKNSYERERQWAFDLAWFFCEFGMEYEPKLVNKRIAWCVRTVIISLLVERGDITYSPAKLSEKFPDREVPYPIGLRRSSLRSAERVHRLKTFLLGFNAIRPDVHSQRDFFEHFDETQNKVALTTYLKLEAGHNGNLVHY